MPGCAKREGCYYGKETVSDRGDGTADHRRCAHAVSRLRREGHPGECPPYQQGLQLEQGLQGVLCGQGTAEPCHPADPQGGGLRRGLLLPDRADAQRGLRLYRNLPAGRERRGLSGHGQARRCQVRHDRAADDRQLQKADAEGRKAVRHPCLLGLQHHLGRLLPGAGSHPVPAGCPCAAGYRCAHQLHQPVRRRGHPVPPGADRERHHGHWRGRAQKV